MNYGSDPADQIVRFSLDGTEMVLKLSGLAAKNFALFVYAVLNDQQKVRGKTKLVRMLKERRPFKFFRIPEDRMREFAREAKDHGLLYTAIRNKSRQGQIELVVFADDASKVNRILDNLNMDFVQAQAGEATVEQVPAVPGTEQPSAVPDKKPEPAVEVETVTTEHGPVDFQVGNNEEEFNFSDTADAAKEQVPENFTSGREPADKAPAEKNPSEPSSPSNGSSSEASGGEKPSVKKELEEIRKEQASKKEEKAKPPQRQTNTPGRTRRKKNKKKTKGR
ncbi:PcfB family protein [Gemmiger formicilis]|uniref:PcfB family protein n=1 Tax=Gemmiger formicilis TaxID=745368 RepID=UPI001FAF487D|nr:PcfB family protein [Gemmiger formicilis]